MNIHNQVIVNPFGDKTGAIDDTTTESRTEGVESGELADPHLGIRLERQDPMSV